MAYVPERIRWINHLSMIMGIRVEYAIPPYTKTQKSAEKWIQ